MSGNVVYIGYHGTSDSVATKIDKGNFSIDYKKIGWLGHGVYFFQEDIEIAKYWANRKFKNRGISVGLLRAEITVPNSFH